jgi:hypothetical protein
VRVDDVGPEFPGLHHEAPPRARVEAHRPGDFPNGDPVACGAPRELAPSSCDQPLLDGRLIAEGAGEQPHLVLSAAPFAAGVDVEDAQGAQRGCAATRPSMRRSSARVNGLWR